MTEQQLADALLGIRIGGVRISKDEALRLAEHAFRKLPPQPDCRRCVLRAKDSASGT